MSADLRADCTRRIDALERQVDEDVSTLRLLEQQWEGYRRVMTEQSSLFEEIGGAGRSNNLVVQGEVAAVREIAHYAQRLTSEQEEARADAVRARRSGVEAEIEGLRRERNELPWD